MSKILKIAIVGTGGIANGKHMPSLAKLDNVEQVAFVDIIGYVANGHASFSSTTPTGSTAKCSNGSPR